MIGGDKDFFRTHRQVHGAADSRNRIRCTGMPVGQITIFSNLEGTQYRDIQVTATHHRERVAMMEIRAAL